MNPRWIRTSRLAVGVVAVLAAACGSQPESPDVEAGFVEHVETAPAGPPTFESDPSWPRPLPNNWALGDVWGVAVDSQDNAWIAHADSDRIQALLGEEGTGRYESLGTRPGRWPRWSHSFCGQLPERSPSGVSVCLIAGPSRGGAAIVRIWE